MKDQLKHQTRFSFLATVLVLAVAVSACGAAAATATPTTAPKLAAPTATTASAVAPTATKAAMVAPTNTPLPQPAATTPPAAAATATKPAAAVPTATQAAASGGAPDGNTPAVIEKAQRALLSQKAYRMTISSTGADGKVTSTIMEYVAPDRLRVAGGSGSDMIIIKDKGMYQKDASTGKWQLIPSSAQGSAAAFAFLDPKQVDELMKSIVVEKFRQVGTDTIGGKPMRVYEYTTAIDIGGTTTNAPSKIWIGVADGLPYRSEGTSDVTGAKTTTVVVYEYDPNIKIEPPV